MPADVLLVADTSQANRKLLSELQRYTCLETISRSQATRKRHKAQKQDVIRLDVGAHEEIYSWPGDPTFSSKDLFTLVGHGLLANGLFEAFAANVFIHDAAVVKAAGEAAVDGKRALQFSFTLPSLGSRWELNWLGARGSAQEKGEFWAQASEFDELSWPGHAAAFFARLSSLQPLAGVTTEMSTDREQMMGVGVQGSHRSVEYVRQVAIPGVASFFLKGSATLPQGFRMSWRTQDVARH